MLFKDCISKDGKEMVNERVEEVETVVVQVVKLCTMAKHLKTHCPFNVLSQIMPFLSFICGAHGVSRLLRDTFLDNSSIINQKEIRKYLIKEELRPMWSEAD